MQKEEAILNFPGLTIYPLQYQIRLEGRILEIGVKEFEILLFLASSAGQVFSKEQIYQAVWNQIPINCENAVMCGISQLRKKIEKNPRKPKYIITVRGVGYKFMVPKE